MAVDTAGQSEHMSEGGQQGQQVGAGRGELVDSSPKSTFANDYSASSISSIIEENHQGSGSKTASARGPSARIAAVGTPTECGRESPSEAAFADPAAHADSDSEEADRDQGDQSTLASPHETQQALEARRRRIIGKQTALHDPPTPVRTRRLDAGPRQARYRSAFAGKPQGIDNEREAHFLQNEGVRLYGWTCARNFKSIIEGFTLDPCHSGYYSDDTTSGESQGGLEGALQGREGHQLASSGRSSSGVSGRQQSATSRASRPERPESQGRDDKGTRVAPGGTNRSNVFKRVLMDDAENLEEALDEADDTFIDEAASCDGMRTVRRVLAGEEGARRRHSIDISKETAAANSAAMHARLKQAIDKGVWLGQALKIFEGKATAKWKRQIARLEAHIADIAQVRLLRLLPPPASSTAPAPRSSVPSAPTSARTMPCARRPVSAC